MRLAIKILTVLFLGGILFLGNMVYRVIFVPEVVSDIAVAHMDRNAGDAPAIALRAHQEASNLGAGISFLFFLAVFLILFVPEIRYALATRKDPERCGKDGPAS